MTFEEFEKSTPSQLRDGARTRFDNAAKMGHGWVGNTSLLLEAQFYLSEIDRRHEAKIVRRDFILELVIIALILAEIVIALWEGKEQAKILERQAAILERVEKARR